MSEKILRDLQIDDPVGAAQVTLIEWVSRRSVALMLRSGGKIGIGSAISVEIGHRHLLATARHVLEDVQFSEVQGLAAGQRFEEELVLREASSSRTYDLAWIEVDPASARSANLASVSLSQFSLKVPEDVRAYFVQGYPWDRVEDADGFLKASVESSGLTTLSVPIGCGCNKVEGVDFGVEYPPHDGSLDDAPLPPPHGVSGGGIWALPRFEDTPVWAPELVKLVAITRSWWKAPRELLGTLATHWLSFVASDLPDTRNEIAAFMEQ